MARQVKCEVCGAMFDAPNNRIYKYCSDLCKKEHNRRNARERDRKKREELNKRQSMKFNNFPSGKAYGEYQARQYMSSHPFVRRVETEKLK